MGESISADDSGKASTNVGKTSQRAASALGLRAQPAEPPPTPRLHHIMQPKDWTSGSGVKACRPSSSAAAAMRAPPTTKGRRQAMQNIDVIAK